MGNNSLFPVMHYITRKELLVTPVIIEILFILCEVAASRNLKRNRTYSLKKQVATESPPQCNPQTYTFFHKLSIRKKLKKANKFSNEVNSMHIKNKRF